MPQNAPINPSAQLIILEQAFLFDENQSFFKQSFMGMQLKKLNY